MVQRNINTNHLVISSEYVLPTSCTANTTAANDNRRVAPAFQEDIWLHHVSRASLNGYVENASSFSSPPVLSESRCFVSSELRMVAPMFPTIRDEDIGSRSNARQMREVEGSRMDDDRPGSAK